ncbi:B3 domain-containing transcription factor VRN1-like isoform X1 [Lotus japonicus]|uniref:B3 domain-containing transcription factor VRN1-like isoform X1 n=1 Tax=Lotus japonicus TaxID=34305 RepID=UPI00258839DC|nr:B3 domain-containing transcription factor VRN1-like isoform X1 [Lotus japonicus]
MTTRNMPNNHSPILFFKIITTTSIEAGELRIPNNFTKRYGGDMSNPMFLKPPDGTEWQICHSKTDGDVWFQNGWKDFAKYYSLDHGHMVLFEYKDSSHFGVHIFDKSTLEIRYPSHENQDEEHNPDQIDDDSVEILDKIPPCKKTKLKSPMSCPKPRKKLRTSTSEDVGERPELHNLPKQVKIEDDVSGNTECLEREDLTSKITEALNRARTFQSKIPSFMTVMKPAYVDGYSLHISSLFAKKYLKNATDVLLQVLDGRTWSVSFNLGKFNAGWKKFASVNNLKVGDVCLFELNKSVPHSLKVLIFPLAEKLHSPSQSPVQGDRVNRINYGRFRYTEIQNVLTTKCGETTKRASKLISPRLRPLTNAALEEANKFNSNNPFFIVNLAPDMEWDYRPTACTKSLHQRVLQ